MPEAEAVAIIKKAFPPGSKDTNGYPIVLKEMDYMVYGNHYSLAIRQLSAVFKFPTKYGIRQNFNKEELHDLWLTIAGPLPYKSARAKSSAIRSHVLRYLHLCIANAFFPKKTTGHGLKFQVMRWRFIFSEARKKKEKKTSYDCPRCPIGYTTLTKKSWTSTRLQLVVAQQQPCHLQKRSTSFGRSKAESTKVNSIDQAMAQ